MKYGNAGKQVGLFYLNTVWSLLLEIPVLTFKLNRLAGTDATSQL